MKISELFEGGSTETQNKKKAVFYSICTGKRSSRLSGSCAVIR